jgi:NDP-sugar pyrophosphorylase family protein
MSTHIVMLAGGHSSRLGPFRTVREFIADGEHLGFPALVERLIEAGRRVGAYEHDGLWLDMRRPEEYEQAAARYEEIAPFLAGAPLREAA